MAARTRTAALALSAGLGLATMVGGPAQAVPTQEMAVSYVVCNSDFSSTTIRAYNVHTGISKLIEPGGCDVGDNSSGGMRIDPDAGFGPDVSRWRQGGMNSCGDGYRAWVSGETPFNPPDAWGVPGCGVRVHND